MLNKLTQIENTGSPSNCNSIGEEIANSITHGIGAALSIGGLTILVILGAKYGDVWHIVSFSIYGGALVLLYLASTLYHSFQKPKVKRVFKFLDHAAIYVLIAGTYTPFMLVNLRGPLGWSLFSTIWGLAILGIIFKIFFLDKLEKLSLSIYLLMGWVCLFAAREMWIEIPIEGLLWLLSGGLIYTLGVLFFRWEKLPYNHAIWHLFVLGGSICHYFSILFYVLPKA
ncbi:MAG: hemolysin III family protein [Bacteroidetes bacterium]|nr:hemolysin III family protein [Bacteroidota bacterium]MDA1121108.1 hemolysin III family protein [Bacteroidota bacterium]